MPRFITCHCTECGEVWKHELDCGDRLCPRCNLKRRSRVMHRFLPMVEAMTERKFLTLTLRRGPLTVARVKRLRDSFTKLRHRGVWAARGGIYQIEIGQLDDLGQCNLHLHAIMDSPFMPQKALSEAWKDITGDSFVVDIQASQDARKALRYMTKHLAKMPMEVEDWQHDLINQVLRDSRLVQGFGNLARVGLSVKDPVCPFCGALGSVVALDFDPAYEDYTPTLRTPLRTADAIE